LQISAARAAAEQAKLQAAERAERMAAEANLCPVCVEHCKNMAFQCGHMVCSSCGTNPGLRNLCPICRVPVVQRITLY